MITDGSQRPHHKRRHTDHEWFYPRANVYRDIWLFLITCVVLVTVLKTIALVHDIQNERVRATLAQCDDQNQRHDRTLNTLSTLANSAGSEARRLRIQASAVLIEALAPRQDCQALARERVQAGK